MHIPPNEFPTSHDIQLQRLNPEVLQAESGDYMLQVLDAKTCRHACVAPDNPYGPLWTSTENLIADQIHDMWFNGASCRSDIVNGVLSKVSDTSENEINSVYDRMLKTGERFLLQSPPTITRTQIDELLAYKKGRTPSPVKRCKSHGINSNSTLGKSGSKRKKTSETGINASLGSAKRSLDFDDFSTPNSQKCPKTAESVDVTNTSPDVNFFGFQSDGYTPEFPLPPHFPTMPVCGSVRIVDKWCGNPNTFRLATWMQGIGLKLYTDYNNNQIGDSCGYIAAHAAHKLNLAQDNWVHEPLPDNLCAPCQITEYNNVLGIQHDNPLRLNGTQIETIAHYLTGEDDLSNWQKNVVSSWRNWLDSPCPINYFLKLVRRRFLSNARNHQLQESPVHITVVNTTPQSKRSEQGDHWITVAYQFNKH